MRLILGKWIALRPAFFFQVRNDVLPGYGTGFFTQQLYHLGNAGLMVSYPSVPHPITLGALKLIEPSMHFFKRSAKQVNRFCTVNGQQATHSQLENRPPGGQADADG
jgi:hypothetical protein